MNQNPEQVARDQIDQQLQACGWIVQKRNKINLNAGHGVAVTEYLTDSGPLTTSSLSISNLLALSKPNARMKVCV